MLSAAACCSSQISESAKALRRKHADILPSPIFILSPCQEECNKIDVGIWGVTEEVFVAARGEALGFTLWKKNHSRGVSRNKNLQNYWVFMPVCTVRCAKQGPIHRHSGHKLLGLGLAVKCSVGGCSRGCAAHALVRHQPALV